MTAVGAAVVASAGHRPRLYACRDGAQALWTGAVLRARHQTLLGVVSNVRSQDGVNVADGAVASGDLDTIHACLHERLKNDTHCRVKESLTPCLAFPLAKLLLSDLGHREISQ